jgi:hypothetical protein
MLMEIACRIGTQKCLYRQIHRIKVETKITKDLNICNSALFYSWVICNVTVSYFIPGFHLYLGGICKYLALMVLLTWNIVNFGFFLQGNFSITTFWNTAKL